MNPIDSSENLPQPPVLKPEIDLTWLKQLFAKNPFYIISAGLLLYGIYRLSIDPAVFPMEIDQLFFNFGSFQIYEALLVATAVMLARRKIWYDSTLLVWLENLFVFIPFILISQALLIGGGIAPTLCFAGCLLAIVRFGSLKKFFGELNLPPKLLVLGAVLLLANVALPLVFRDGHRISNSFTAEIHLYPLSERAWLFVLPLLLGLGNFLPKPADKESFSFRQSWFPGAMFAVWTLVTGVHLYCIGYVYALKWNFSYLMPTLWVATWTLRNRLGDFVAKEWINEGKNLLLFPPIVITLIAVFYRNWTMLFTLTTLNALAYGVLTVRNRNKFAFQLLLASLALMVPGIPQEFLGKFNLYFFKADLLKASFAAYFVFQSILSRNPKMGVFGAIIATVTTGIFFNDHNFYFHVALQVGFIFLLIHSLRWEDGQHPGAASARIFTAGFWLLHSFVWLANDGDIAFWTTSSLALATLAVYFAVKVIFGCWGPRVVPYAAALVLICQPSLLFVDMVKGTSIGLLAVAVSFVLFALGTIAALTKNRWNKTERFTSTTAPNQ